MKRRRALPYCLRMIFRKIGAHFSGSRSGACGESWPLDRVVCSAGGIVAQQEALDDAGAWFRRRLGKSGNALRPGAETSCVAAKRRADSSSQQTFIDLDQATPVS